MTFNYKDLIVVLSVSLSACSGDGQKDVPSPDTPLNATPTTNAGIDQSVNEQVVVTLSGVANDSDGTIASYSWLQTAGTNVSLSNANSATASFTAPTLTTAETFTFSLTATDNEGSSASDSTIISVNPVNVAPTANAGEPQTVNSGATVTLTATSSIDSDGTIARYAWTQTAGTSVSLNNANESTANFIATGVSKGETLTFTLLVTDNEEASNNTTINVLINTPPSADAGSDQAVDENAVVTLDGSESSDIDDDTNNAALDYSWSRADTHPEVVTLSDGYAIKPTFSAPSVTENTTFIFELAVTDSGNLSSTDSVAITVQPTPTHPLNDTGLTWGANYPSGNNVDCSGNDVEEQDCSHGRDAQAKAGTLVKVGAGSAGFDFTKLDSNGDELTTQDASWSDTGDEANGTQWSCVQDNHTGLMWEVKTNDDGLRDKDHTYTWYNSAGINDGGGVGIANGGSCVDSENCDTEKYAIQVNSQGLCGANDWRLPNREALHSIIDYGKISPAIDTTYYPNTVTRYYWSSSALARDSYIAWMVDFGYGFDNGYGRFDYVWVRLVRGGL